jgi:hypothetical protein
MLTKDCYLYIAHTRVALAAIPLWLGCSQGTAQPTGAEDKGIG